MPGELLFTPYAAGLPTRPLHQLVRACVCARTHTWNMDMDMDMDMDMVRACMVHARRMQGDATHTRCSTRHSPQSSTRARGCSHTSCCAAAPPRFRYAGCYRPFSTCTCTCKCTCACTCSAHTLHTRHTFHTLHTPHTHSIENTSSTICYRPGPGPRRAAELRAACPRPAARHGYGWLGRPPRHPRRRCHLCRRDGGYIHTHATCTYTCTCNMHMHIAHVTCACACACACISGARARACVQHRPEPPTGTSPLHRRPRALSLHELFRLRQRTRVGRPSLSRERRRLPSVSLRVRVGVRVG